MKFDFRTLDPNDSQTPPALLKGYLEAVNRGFHLTRVDDHGEKIWTEVVRGDKATLRGAWLEPGEFGASDIPVATVASWRGEINTGAGTIPGHMISDVSVAPASRRQGLARRLITDTLDDAVGQGLPIAALTVTEGGIYRRFGFGPATFKSDIEVDVTRRFAFDEFTPFGRFVQVEPSDLGDVPDQLFDQWHATHRGSVSRNAGYAPLNRGEWNWDEQGPEPRMRAVVHLDDDGKPHGYVLYAHGGWGTDHTVTVRDSLSLTPEGHLSLWVFLSGIDLTDKVKARVSPDHPLMWALRDPRCVRRVGPSDQIWLRILDVVTALEARPWFGDGDVVIGVIDSMGHADGQWAVSVRDGRATVTRSDDQPEISMDVSTLGSTYLGGVPTNHLVHSGRLRGDAAALETWARISDGGPVPYSQTSF